MMLVFVLAREVGGFSTERLVLTGLAVYFVLMAATNGLIFASGNRGAESAIFWMLGGLGNTRWHLLPAPLIAVVIGTGWLLWRARALDALSLGDEAAHTLGIPVQRLRFEMFLATSLIAGVLVSASGAVGFIGLIIPHCARWIAGAEMRRTIPVAALIGAIFTVWVDAAAGSCWRRSNCRSGGDSGDRRALLHASCFDAGRRSDEPGRQDGTCRGRAG